MDYNCAIQKSLWYPTFLKMIFKLLYLIYYVQVAITKVTVGISEKACFQLGQLFLF